MEDQPQGTSATPAANRPLQFSLRTLFLVTTVSAVVFSAWFTGPYWLKVFSLLFMLLALPAALTTALIYGRGYLRTFCIGALFPAVLLCSLLFWLLLLAGFDGFDPISDGVGAGEAAPSALLLVAAFYVGIPYGVSLAVGLLAVAVRRMIEEPQRWEASAAKMPPGYLPPSAAEQRVPHWHCRTCGRSVSDTDEQCGHCHTAKRAGSRPSDSKPAGNRS